MASRVDPFKETFEKTNQTVIEHGISKSFYAKPEMTNKELDEVKKQLAEYRSSCFQTIYGIDPNMAIGRPWLENFVLILDGQCTWDEYKLNQLQNHELGSIRNLLERISDPDWNTI